MLLTPLQPDSASPTSTDLGLVRVEPMPLRGGLLSSHGSWGMAGSLAVHVAAVAAFGGWLGGWMPEWLPPAAGQSSQAQSGELFTSIATAPASEPEELLRETPPIQIETTLAPAAQPTLAAIDKAFDRQPAAGRPISLVLPDVPPAPPLGEERSIIHQATPSTTSAPPPQDHLPTPNANPTPARRILASSRPVVSTQASAPAAIGSRAQAGAQTNAQLQAIFSPEPVYPPQALAAGQSGKVVVRIRIDAAGMVASARVQVSSGNPLLDEAALVAVRRWRFSPREGNGSEAVDRAVPIRFDIEKKM